MGEWDSRTASPVINARTSACSAPFDFDRGALITWGSRKLTFLGVEDRTCQLRRGKGHHLGRLLQSFPEPVNFTKFDDSWHERKFVTVDENTVDP